jgi:hypothetical protein
MVIIASLLRNVLSRYSYDILRFLKLQNGPYLISFTNLAGNKSCKIIVHTNDSEKV